MQVGDNLATVTGRHTDWNTINWKMANRNVRNLRQRIFRATQEGDLQKVRSLQKLMLRSYSNRLVTVRKVTQLNQGRNTAGVDKVKIKAPQARSRLIDELTALDIWKARPTRRTYIPKKMGRKDHWAFRFLVHNAPPNASFRESSQYAISQIRR